LSRFKEAAGPEINPHENLTEQVSIKISKNDYAMLMKLIDAKGSTITNVCREALHILFAHHGMMPEETTRLLLGQFIQEPRVLQTVKARPGAQ
jgi:hypothetical protein